ATPLLLHFLRNDPAASVRTACIGQLAILKRFDELAEILKANDGQLRLAAAMALGDNGIYAAIPIFMEALRLSDAGLPEHANDKLREYTGREFGFLPRAPAEEREKAIKRWEEWWKEEGPALVKRSLKGWREGEVSEEDRNNALGQWREGNKILEQIDARDRGE